MTINNEESLSKIHASQYDVIVFEEIYFVDICKLSKIENIHIPSTMFTMKINNKIVIETQKYERININNEWNVDEICNNIIKYKHVTIRADLQGSGKTYAAQHMIKLGYRVLFVCPTNKLAQNNGVNGVTINNFLV